MTIYADFDGYWWARLSTGEVCGPYESAREAREDCAEDAA